MKRYQVINKINEIFANCLGCQRAPAKERKEKSSVCKACPVGAELMQLGDELLSIKYKEVSLTNEEVFFVNKHIKALGKEKGINKASERLNIKAEHINRFLKETKKNLTPVTA
ncbi:hypothetical protein [Alkalihalobacillus pseudalcaliphilus]|uniref:hypothetical protein n=1 Tax=Alkalihalobacillus pseudalcaliphilus TaxID=79884 RepID=UPI00064E00FC|nr:hypothetical protein [Alkalihalobacillus pseudalcaliphilus]KMK77603.1 hypothetical protein AB990_03825 [Alkalihalobacillus pseudalcaliphilus]